MTIRLYLDEDTSDADLLEALRIRGVDVIAAVPSGRRGERDDDQLRWAAEQNRVLYSFNRGDFCRIHSMLIRLLDKRGETQSRRESQRGRAATRPEPLTEKERDRKMGCRFIFTAKTAG
jgi:hypothetical protein